MRSPVTSYQFTTAPARQQRVSPPVPDERGVRLHLPASRTISSRLRRRRSVS